MERYSRARRHNREVTGPSPEEMSTGALPRYVIGGIFPAFTYTGDRGFMADVPGDEGGMGWDPKGNPRYPGLYGWTQDAAPALVSGVDDIAGMVDEDWLPNKESWLPAQRIGIGTYARRDGMRGSFLDGYGVLVGDLGGPGIGFNPSIWGRRGVGDFTRREGFKGSFRDSEGTLVSGFDSAAALPWEQALRLTPEEVTRRLAKASETLKAWAAERRFPVGDRFIARSTNEGMANALGYVIHLPSVNDRITVAEKAKDIANKHGLYYKMSGESEGYNVGPDEYIVFFSDDPAGVEIVAAGMSVDGASRYCCAGAEVLTDSLERAIAGDGPLIGAAAARLHEAMERSWGIQDIIGASQYRRTRRVRRVPRSVVPRPGQSIRSGTSRSGTGRSAPQYQGSQQSGPRRVVIARGPQQEAPQVVYVQQEAPPEEEAEYELVFDEPAQPEVQYVQLSGTHYSAKPIGPFYGRGFRNDYAPASRSVRRGAGFQGTL